MAKINLLTIHWGKCYGAVMQTYATCKLLEESGHEVHVINLIHPSTKKTYKRLRKWVDLFREFQFYLFKKKYFSNLTSKSYEILYNKLPSADYYAVGSDQVWNKDITAPFYLDYFLHFVPNGIKRISLSSSFGKTEWNQEETLTNEVKNELNKFVAVSVREDSGVELLHDIFNISSIQLPDPTIGYGSFDKLLPNRNPKHQLFTFLFKNTLESKAIVEGCASQLHIPVYKNNRLNSYFRNGPIDWLSNIANSDFVITDSFHGLALSLLFNKQFIVLCANEKKFTRLSSLLRLVKLENRFVKSFSDFENRKFELLKHIDYSMVNKILESERRRYQLYIDKNIK